jgi:Flp pilus assembly protein protease CpaA
MNIVFLSILPDAFFITLLAWCSYTDIKCRSISNKAIVLMLCLGIARMIWVLFNSRTWVQYPAGLLLSVPFYIAWLKNSMGAGDVKLITAIALYMGLFNTLIVFAFLVPVLAAMMLHSWAKHKTIKLKIPLAPVIGICASGTIVLGYLYELISN